MRIGLALPQYDFSVASASPLPWQTVVDWARRAEHRGLASVWLADHLFLGVEKYGGPAGEHFGYDPIVGLGALARATERVSIGTLVLCVQLRPPRLLARQLRTLQEIANGRLIPGFGAGWYEPEYRAAGIAFESPRRRLEQLASTLDVIADTDPDLPRWVGGRGDRLLELVAQHATGWNTVWAWTPDDYRERVTVLRRACERIGREPSEITLSVGLFALVGENDADLTRRYERMQQRTLPGVVSKLSLDDWRVGRLVGTPDQVREQVEEWRSIGVAELIAGPGALPFSVSDPDDLDLLASALID